MVNKNDFDPIYLYREDTKQSKYDNAKDFNERRELSDIFVDYVANIISNTALSVLDTNEHELFSLNPRLDDAPNTTLTGKEKRSSDIGIVYSGRKHPVSASVEVKDMPRFVKHYTMALPIKYVKKHLTVNPVDKTMVVFRDNINVFKFYCFKMLRINLLENNTDWEKVAEMFGFCELKSDSEENKMPPVLFEPYGNSLDVLMENRNLTLEANQKYDVSLRSSMRGYEGEYQYIWDMGVMMPFKKLIRDKISKWYELNNIDDLYLWE